MTDNHNNTNASKTVEAGHKSAHPVQNDAKGNSHSMHNDAAMKSPQVSVHEKTGTHKEVSADPKFKDQNMHKDTEMKNHDMKMQHGPGHETGDLNTDAGMKSAPISGHEKTGTHKEVSADPKSKDHPVHKDAEIKVEHVSHEKTGTHKDVSAEAMLAVKNMKEIHAQIAGA